MRFTASNEDIAFDREVLAKARDADATDMIRELHRRKSLHRSDDDVISNPRLQELLTNMSVPVDIEESTDRSSTYGGAGVEKFGFSDVSHALEKLRDANKNNLRQLNTKMSHVKRLARNEVEDEIM